MVDLEIHDRALGRDKEIGRVRLNFSFVVGTEMSFAGKSLMYGFDGRFYLSSYCGNMFVDPSK
jgi:hypothetical protein